MHDCLMYLSRTCKSPLTYVRHRAINFQTTHLYHTSYAMHHKPGNAQYYQTAPPPISVQNKEEGCGGVI